MANYKEIKDLQPTLTECFFAFSNEQFNEGIKKAGIEGQKIYSGHGGLFGTNDGIQSLYSFYENTAKRIGNECDPQEVYDYEFVNHECGYVGDDEEAIKIVASHFTDEQTKAVKRRFARTAIDNLKFD